jgi:autotransporter-associated beta strand protein
MKPQAKLRNFLAFAGSSLLAISSAHAVDGNWNTNFAGNWSDATKWSSDPAIPGGIGSIVGINSNITNNDLTVTIDTDSRTVGHLTIGDSNNTHRFRLAASGGASLIFDNGLSDATLTETGSIADSITAPITLNSNLAINTAGTLTLSGDISGLSNGITKSGGGTLIMTGTNTYTGTTTINAGTLNLGNSTATGSLDSTALALGGGTLSYTRNDSATQTFSTTAINPGASSVSTVAGNTLALGAITRSIGGTLNVGAAGAITTSSSNVNDILGPWASFNTGAATTYATVSGGNIVGLGYTGGADGVAPGAASIVTDTTGLLNYSVNTAAGTFGADASINTLRYTAAASTLTTASSFTTNGIMNSGSGLLTISGNITIGATNEILNGVNTYTGDTTVNGGTLQIGRQQRWPAGRQRRHYAGNISIASGATLSIASNVNQTLSGIISGAGNLTKENSGTLFLGNSNTYTGKTTISPTTSAGATISIASFNSVVGGTASSSLGAPTTVANGTIDLGNAAAGRGAAIAYTGAGETTDRVINFRFNNNGSVHSISNTGAGLLKFTSAPTGSGDAQIEAASPLLAMAMASSPKGFLSTSATSPKTATAPGRSAARSAAASAPPPSSPSTPAPWPCKRKPRFTTASTPDGRPPRSTSKAAPPSRSTWIPVMSMD